METDDGYQEWLERENQKWTESVNEKWIEHRMKLLEDRIKVLEWKLMQRDHPPEPLTIFQVREILKDERYGTDPEIDFKLLKKYWIELLQQTTRGRDDYKNMKENSELRKRFGKVYLMSNFDQRMRQKYQ